MKTELDKFHIQEDICK